MNKSHILILTLIVFSLSLVSAEYLPHELNTNLTYSFTDTIATECNQTTLTTPHGESLSIIAPLSVSQSTFTGFVLGTNFSREGVYCINIECDDGHGAICRDVTFTGDLNTTADSILYAILFFMAIFLTTLSLWGAVAINGQNEFEMGKLIKINYNKYIKQGLFFLGYLFLTITIFFATEIAQQFLSGNFFVTTLVWIHKFMWIAFFPIFIIFVTFSLIKWLADLELMDLAKRNLKPYGT